MKRVLNRDIEELLEKVKSNNLVLDESSPPPNLGYALSAIAMLEESDFEIPVLWLDGGNSFNPYSISELSRNIGLDPERLLQEVYISRAFTCYQMMTLIHERLDKAITEFVPGPIIVTDLPGLFSESDLSETEALKAFDSVVEELERFRNKGKTILLTAPRDMGNGKDGFVSRLEEISDDIIEADKEKTRSKNCSHPRKRKIDSGPSARAPTLEEFA